MAVIKLGTWLPDARLREAEEVLTEFRHFAEPDDEVDATFNVYDLGDGDVYIGWDLEAVGLVTWLRADSVEEAEVWVYEQLTPWAHLDERGEYVACDETCNHGGGNA